MPVWRNPEIVAEALSLARTRRVDFVLIGDSRGAFQGMGWDHGIQQALISSGIKIYGTGLMAPGEHGTLGSNAILSGGGVGIGYRAARLNNVSTTLADSGRISVRGNSRVHPFSLRNMEAADISALQAGNLATWNTTALTNYAPNDPLWFNGIRNLGIASIVGSAGLVTVTCVGNHGLPPSTSSLTLRGTPVPAWNSTFTCTNTGNTTFTFSQATPGTYNTAGTTYGWAKLASGAAFDGNDAIGIVMERGSPVGNDAALRAHVWMSKVGGTTVAWSWFANGGSAVASSTFNPTTSITRMDADLPAPSIVAGTASPGRAANTEGVEFRVPTSGVGATGLFWTWTRVTRPDRTAGAALSVLYALGGQSSYDMATALAALPAASLADYFARVAELQTGDKYVYIYLSTGMNDANESSKLPGAPDGFGYDPHVVKFNIRSIYNLCKTACDTAGVRMKFILIGDYPRGTSTEAAEILGASYRTVMDQLALENPLNIAFGNLSQIVSFAELVDTGTDMFRAITYGAGATNGTATSQARAHPYLASGKTARFTGGTTVLATGVLTATLAPAGVVTPTHIRIEGGTNVVPGVYAVTGSGPTYNLPLSACVTGNGTGVVGTAIDCIHLEEDLSFQNLALAAFSASLQEAYATAVRIRNPESFVQVKG